MNSISSFNGKTIWITGASSGIGEHLCYALSKAGATLIMSARRESELARVRAQCSHPEKHHLVLLDMQDCEAIIATANKVLGEVGDIHYLFNNAGITQRAAVVDLELATSRKVFEVNYFAKITLTRALLPHMLKRGNGHIITISSIAGLVGVPYRSAYSSSKAAIISFMSALRVEVFDQGIDVSTICPGFVKTSIVETAKREGTASANADASMIDGGMEIDEAVEQMLIGVAKKKSLIIVATGVEKFAPYIQRFFPRLMFKIIRKAAPKP
ncbi:MAG: SDR family oxidoreductase [Oleibacter sp.]|nr:SDR family oxidoreductase [Thalassolituus sp.]